MKKTVAYKDVTLPGMRSVADDLLQRFSSDVVVFRGAMGSGKTTLIKEICAGLGVADPTGSPTFSVVNEYLASNGGPVYHFDFYRINSEEEAYDIGYEEYFYSGALCLVEWPEKVESILPETICEVIIEKKDRARDITLVY